MMGVALRIPVREALLELLDVIGIGKFAEPEEGNKVSTDGSKTEESEEGDKVSTEDPGKPKDPDESEELEHIDDSDNSEETKELIHRFEELRNITAEGELEEDVAEEPADQLETPQNKSARPVVNRGHTSKTANPVMREGVTWAEFKNSLADFGDGKIDGLLRGIALSVASLDENRDDTVAKIKASQYQVKEFLQPIGADGIFLQTNEELGDYLVTRGLIDRQLIDCLAKKNVIDKLSEKVKCYVDSDGKHICRVDDENATDQLNLSNPKLPTLEKNIMFDARDIFDDLVTGKCSNTDFVQFCQQLVIADPECTKMFREQWNV